MHVLTQQVGLLYCSFNASVARGKNGFNVPNVHVLNCFTSLIIKCTHSPPKNYFLVPLLLRSETF